MRIYVNVGRRREVSAGKGIKRVQRDRTDPENVRSFIEGDYDEAMRLDQVGLLEPGWSPEHEEELTEGLDKAVDGLSLEGDIKINEFRESELLDAETINVVEPELEPVAAPKETKKAPPKRNSRKPKT